MSTVEIIGGCMAIMMVIYAFFGGKALLLGISGIIGWYLLSNHWTDNIASSVPKMIGFVLLGIALIKALALLSASIIPLLLTGCVVAAAGMYLYSADQRAGGGWTEIVRNKTQQLQTQLPTVDDLKDKLKTVASNCTVGQRTYARSATVDMTDAAPNTVLCDGLPTQACLNGCVYQVSTSNCDSKGVHGFKDSGRYLAFVETWWVSNGQPCH